MVLLLPLLFEWWTRDFRPWKTFLHLDGISSPPPVGSSNVGQFGGNGQCQSCTETFYLWSSSGDRGATVDVDKEVVGADSVLHQTPAVQ
jgi:hypothetical protein